MKLSIVDVSTVLPGESRTEAFRHSIELAQFAERAGFTRFWLAEHHAAAFIAGRAPEVLIAAIAANTTTIKVGSGSVLLNHYSPYKVAEVFCTLNELYPGRIDLGAGRATTGPVSDFALQQDRTKQIHADSDQQINELVAWLDNSFPASHPFSKTKIHTIDSLPELHMLGSSAWSAGAAASLGLRYVFAGFINQAGASEIIDSYRRKFQPSRSPSGILSPNVKLAIHVVCADTEEEANHQLAPVRWMYRNLSIGNLNAPVLRPREAVEALGGIPVLEKYVPGSRVVPKFVGGNLERVQDQLESIATDFDVEEIIVQDLITEHHARLRSYELLSKLIR
ncbi:MAG: MsnO8 family LLM class oxidoreductase [Chitinophagaceae bacterium]|nr:MsnO8 family LLM class oxidoreductase [Chitinophagaceae bacterium]